MSHPASLPFISERGSDVFSGGGNDEHMGSKMPADQEVQAVREIVVPLSGVSGAIVRRQWRWLDWPTGPRLVLTASDLGAFEELTGRDGLSLDHPAKVVLRPRRADALVGREFGAELALAKAQYDLAALERRAALPRVIAARASRP